MKWPAWVSHSRTIHLGSADNIDWSKEGVLGSGCCLGAEAAVKRHPRTRKLEYGELMRRHNLFCASSNQRISEFSCSSPKSPLCWVKTPATADYRQTFITKGWAWAWEISAQGKKNQLEMVSEGCRSQWKEVIKIKGPSQLLKQAMCKCILARRRGIVWSDVVSAGFQKGVLPSRPSNRDISLFQQDIESGHCESKSHWVVYWFKEVLFVSSFSPVNLQLQEWSRMDYVLCLLRGGSGDFMPLL